MHCYPRNYAVAELSSSLVTLSGGAVVSVDEFKTWAKIDGDAENALIAELIEAATNEAETYTRRAIRAGEYQALTNLFYYTLEMDVSNIDVDTIAVKYYDVNNAEQTLASSEYTVKDFGPDKFVQIVFDGTMPSLYDRWDAVKIEFDAGYVSIPGRIKTWIMEKAGGLYEVRQDVVISALAHNVFGYAPLMPYRML